MFSTWINALLILNIFEIYSWAVIQIFWKCRLSKKPCFNFKREIRCWHVQAIASRVKNDFCMTSVLARMQCIHLLLIVINRNVGFGLAWNWGYPENFGFGPKRVFVLRKVNRNNCDKFSHIHFGFGQNWTNFGWIQLNFNQTLGSIFAKAYSSAGFLNYAKNHEL